MLYGIQTGSWGVEEGGVGGMQGCVGVLPERSPVAGGRFMSVLWHGVEVYAYVCEDLAAPRVNP